MKAATMKWILDRTWKVSACIIGALIAAVVSLATKIEHDQMQLMERLEKRQIELTDRLDEAEESLTFSEIEPTLNRVSERIKHSDAQILELQMKLDALVKSRHE